MKYQIYKFDFLTAVHLGIGTPDSTNYVFSSDTLFSALCQEAVKRGQKELDHLVDLVRNDRIRLSDGLPYIRDEYYLPKPVIYIGAGNDEGNSLTKKAYKNLKYVAVSQFDSYLHGTMDIERTHDMDALGRVEMKVSANIRSSEDTLPYRGGPEEDTGEALPYRIGIYRYMEGSGLYVVIGYEDDRDCGFIEELLVSLSYSGIGGRRSSGFGRFALKRGKVSSAGDLLIRALENNKADYQMLVSQALPANDEIDCAMDGATYTLMKRSGFVSSPNYADEFRRKKDLYVFACGSVFRSRFSGDVYDVGDGGRHAVYRYAKSLFIGFDLEVSGS